MDKFPTGVSGTFPSIPHKKTNSCRFGRRVPRFELLVQDIMLVNFGRRVHNMLFHQRSTSSLARLSLMLRSFMLAVLKIV
jgi:hypothetical protein